MKLIFMGTPEFSANVLEGLVNAGHIVTAVYTQPDKEKGRGKKTQMSPVKLYALSKEIPVYQPLSLKRASVKQELSETEAEAIVVAAYGKILPKEVLEMKKYGCINVHASLLPKYRGASPIEHAILNGETETGVTIMQMDEGLDTGDILKTAPVKIEDTDTLGTLTEKLSNAGIRPLLEVLNEAVCGTLTPVKQGETTTEYAGMLEKEDGLIDFTKDAGYLERFVRALDPRPSAYTYINGKLLKIWRASVSDNKTESIDDIPGEIISVKKDRFTVKCGSGNLDITEVQLEGKKRMPVDAFLRGTPVTCSIVLGKG